jgi:pyridoxal phosphate enzyme (YggS family)
MISENIAAIRGRIADACARSGRDASGVTLVAVAKTFPAEFVHEAVASGVHDVGENYVQELLSKRQQLHEAAVRWHFIGHLQSNKVRLIVPWIHLIHAVDSEGLIREIDRRAAGTDRVIDCLVEVNTTGEEVLPLVRRTADFRHVRIAGLMTIGPFLPDPEGSRPMFRLLRELRNEANGEGVARAPMTELSMGMTGDFEVAIEEGATLIRIGTAIFGSRKRPDHQERKL